MTCTLDTSFSVSKIWCSEGIRIYYYDDEEFNKKEKLIVIKNNLNNRRILTWPETEQWFVHVQ